jgi:hypothetical protein
MRISRATRVSILRGVLVAGVLTLAVGVFGTWYTVHVRVGKSTVVSVVAGRARVYWWDPSVWKILYNEPVIEKASRWSCSWLPGVRWGGAAKGKGRWPRQWEVAVPLWMPGAACAGLYALGRRRGWAHEPGHCRRCGYDLRGVTGEVCPECGAAIVISGGSQNVRLVTGTGLR